MCYCNFCNEDISRIRHFDPSISPFYPKLLSCNLTLSLLLLVLLLYRLGISYSHWVQMAAALQEAVDSAASSRLSASEWSGAERSLWADWIMHICTVPSKQVKTPKRASTMKLQVRHKINIFYCTLKRVG